MELKELKAMAYDTLANIEMLQAKFKQVNEEIAKKAQEEKAAMDVPVELGTVKEVKPE